MPQTFVALQCAFCHTYQGQLDKKSKKFTCVICSQKQSFRTIFAVSNSGKDIRLTVQQLNELKGAAEEVQGDVNTTQLRLNQLVQHEAANQHRNSKVTTNWDDYACQDEVECSDTDAAETGFVTALADNRQAKRKRRAEDHTCTDDRSALCHNKGRSSARPLTPMMPAHVQSHIQQPSQQQPATLCRRTTDIVATGQPRDMQHTVTRQGQTTSGSLTKAAAQMGQMCHPRVLSSPNTQCIPPRCPLQPLRQQSDADADAAGVKRDTIASADLCKKAATASEQQQQQQDRVVWWHGAAKSSRNAGGTFAAPAAAGPQQQEALLKGPGLLDSRHTESCADGTQQRPHIQPGWRQQAMPQVPPGQQPLVCPSWRQQHTLDQLPPGQQQHLHHRPRCKDHVPSGRHVQPHHSTQAAKTVATAGAWAAFMDDPGLGGIEAESDDDVGAAQFVTDINAADECT